MFASTPIAGASFYSLQVSDIAFDNSTIDYSVATTKIPQPGHRSHILAELWGEGIKIKITG